MTIFYCFQEFCKSLTVFRLPPEYRKPKIQTFYKIINIRGSNLFFMLLII